MIIGIDPGFTGALACYNNGGIISIIDMPLLMHGGKSALDSKTIYSWLLPLKPQLVVIERVHSMPGQGISSTFRFGEGFGILQGIVATLPNCRVLMPPPAVWKVIMGVTANKDTSLERVRREFPLDGRYFSRKKDNGRAEALLLAMFGARSLGVGGSHGGDIRDIF